MISIRIVSTPANIDNLRERGPYIIERLMEKMNLIDLEVASRAVDEVQALFPNGAPNIAATIRAEPVEVDGTVIRGNVDAGGPATTKTTLSTGQAVDYAAVQHAGIDHSYIIRPFSKRALAFEMDGNKVVVASVVHPGLKPRPFMTNALEAMQEKIVADLSATWTELVA